MDVRDKLLCKRMGYSKEICRSNDKTSLRSEKELANMLDVKRNKNIVCDLKALRHKFEKAGVSKRKTRGLLLDSATSFCRFDVKEDIRFIFEEEKIQKLSEKRAAAILLGESL